MHRHQQGIHHQLPRVPAEQLVGHECQSTRWHFLADCAAVQWNRHQYSHYGWMSPHTTAKDKFSTELVKPQTIKGNQREDQYNTL